MITIRAGVTAFLLALPAACLAQARPEQKPAPAPTETIAAKLPGFRTQAYGRWLAAKDNQSGVPLGGLGTGFIELRPDARIHDMVTRNNWTSPKPPASCALTLAFPGGGAKAVDLIRSAADGAAHLPASARYFGHFPIADLDYGRPSAQAPVRAWVRAFSSFIPRDSAASNEPAALFAVELKNEGQKRQPVTVALRWSNDLGVSGRSSGNVDGLLGWRRASLPPRGIWTVSCAHLVATTDAEMQKALRDARAAQMPDIAELERTCTSDERRLALGGTSFELDEWGAFNWEAVEHETALVGGAPSLGQVLYSLQWGGKPAGVEFVSGGANRGFGLKLVSPLRTDASRAHAFARMATDDGMLALTQVCSATDAGLVRWFVIENRSPQALPDCAFGYYANVDVGGTKGAEAGSAVWRDYGDGASGIEFAGPSAGPRHALLAWKPAATHTVVGNWPDTPVILRGTAWPTVAALRSRPESGEAFVSGKVQGVQMRAPTGKDTAAVAVDGSGWSATTTTSTDGGVSASVTATLAPGETKRAWLAFAWHSPTWRSSDGQTCMNRYGANSLNAASEATYALGRAASTERRIIAWQEPIYQSTVPPWLKDALVNGLYSFARNTIWLDDGRFFHSESFTGCPITETLVCRFNGSVTTVEMFPELEKATMRQFAKAQAASGQIAFAFGGPVGVATPMLDLQKPIVSSEYVLMCRRDALWTKDAAFAKDIYPSAKRAMQFAMTLDTDGDGLINDAPGSESGFPANQYYDIWPWFGTSAYTAGIGQAALRAAEEMARDQGDSEFEAWCHERFEKGLAAYEELLWNGRHYRLYNDFDHGRMSESCLVNQLCGQLHAWACKLGDLHPRENALSALREVAYRNVRGTQWGAIAGVLPDGTPDQAGTSQSREVVVGETWNWAASALIAAQQAKDETLRGSALTAAENAYKAILQSGTLWDQHFSYSATTGLPVWGRHYYSNLGIWILPFALGMRPVGP